MDQLTESSQVKVTLLLSGGHEYMLFLKSDDPLLENLFKILIARSQKQDKDISALLQITIESENSALCFPAEHLIGLVTEPPLFIKNLPNPAPKTPQSAQERLPYPSEDQEVLPSKFIQIDNFLNPQDLKALLAFAMEKEPEFVPTTTSTNAENYRQSLVLYNFPQFATLLTQKVALLVPRLCQDFSIPAFDISQIEKQLTSHNDGHFYKVHNDNGSPKTANRQLSYVYYFNEEPKSFTGGELLIYDSKIKNNYYVKADSFQTVEPRNNSIVFFLSRYHHEVLTVKCPSRNFAHSRFTINGWIRS